MIFIGSKVLFVIIWVGAVLDNAEGKWGLAPEQYCCLKCESRHVLCQYPKPVVSENCMKAQVTPLTPRFIHTLVKRINIFRNEAAKSKGIAGMMVMHWNTNLAFIAQRWANQCQTKKADCVDTIHFEAMNVVYKIQGYNSLDKAIDNFVVSLFPNNPKEFKLEPSISEGPMPNFAAPQLAGLNQVGCGYVEYFSNNEDTFHISCNFAPNPDLRDPYVHKLVGVEYCPTCPLPDREKCRDRVYIYLCNNYVKLRPDYIIIVGFMVFIAALHEE